MWIIKNILISAYQSVTYFISFQFIGTLPKGDILGSYNDILTNHLITVLSQNLLLLWLMYLIITTIMCSVKFNLF